MTFQAPNSLWQYRVIRMYDFVNLRVRAEFAWLCCQYELNHADSMVVRAIVWMYNWYTTQYMGEQSDCHGSCPLVVTEHENSYLRVSEFIWVYDFFLNVWVRAPFSFILRWVIYDNSCMSCWLDCIVFAIELIIAIFCMLTCTAHNIFLQSCVWL